jgi:hypothetical protein
MLLDIRERGREAEANRQAEARPAIVVRADPPAPAPVVRADPPAPVFEGRGFFQPAAPRPEPPRFVPRFNDGGDFDWIDDPSTCARLTVTLTILILIRVNQLLRSSPTNSPAK